MMQGKFLISLKRKEKEKKKEKVVNGGKFHMFVFFITTDKIVETPLTTTCSKIRPE